MADEDDTEILSDGWFMHVTGKQRKPATFTIYDIKRDKPCGFSTGSVCSCPFPFVSLLFNTTTKDIEEIANSKLFSSGFFPRIMWFFGQGGQPRKNKDITQEDLDIIENIKQDIHNLRELLSPLQNDSIVFGVCDIIEDWN